jgi:hypothetical protein
MKVLLVMLLAVLAACNPERTVTEGVLDRERFKAVLLEAQLIEARVNHELIVQHVSNVPAQQYYAELFSEQGITEEQFRVSFEHYAARPEEMKAIYEEIMTELVLRKDAPVP